MHPPRIINTTQQQPQYSQAYPKTAPQLALSDRRGISEAEAQELLALLVARSQELVGEVMVYELILVAGAFLVGVGGYRGF